MDTKTSYILHFGREYHGTFPSIDAAMEIYRKALADLMAKHPKLDQRLAELTLGSPVVVPAMVSREQLEIMLDDEIDDELWEGFR